MKSWHLTAISTNDYGSVTRPYRPLQDPSGICERLHEPARGIQSWHLTALYLQTVTDLLPTLRTVIRPPSGICEYPYEPARGIQELAPDYYTELAPYCYTLINTEPPPPTTPISSTTCHRPTTRLYRLLHTPPTYCEYFPTRYEPLLPVIPSSILYTPL
jgi:hypothetical protein